MSHQEKISFLIIRALLSAGQLNALIKSIIGLHSFVYIAKLNDLNGTFP